MIKRLLPHGGGYQVPDRLIVHAMGEWIVDNDGNAYYADEWLKVIGLSAHRLITPSGTEIQCRPDNRVAYHAKGHNVNTIGVEFLVPGVFYAGDYGSGRDRDFLEVIKTDYLTVPQYHKGVGSCRGILSEHGIEAVERHSDIDPENKSDPGAGFPMDIFLEDIR